jgi:hypothetical protein
LLPGLPAPSYDTLTGEAVEALDGMGGGHLPLEEILASFPVALLYSG